MQILDFGWSVEPRQVEVHFAKMGVPSSILSTHIFFNLVPVLFDSSSKYHKLFESKKTLPLKTITFGSVELDQVGVLGKVLKVTEKRGSTARAHMIFHTGWALFTRGTRQSKRSTKLPVRAFTARMNFESGNQ